MRKTYILSAFCLLTLALSGCSLWNETPKPASPAQPAPAVTSEKEQEAVLTVYEVTSDFLKVKPVQVKVKTKEDLHKAALTEMISRDRNLKYPLLPKNLSIIGVEVKDGIATVNFSKELNELRNSATAEELFTALVANTLTEFPDVKEVKFLEEGNPVTKLTGHSDMT